MKLFTNVGRGLSGFLLIASLIFYSTLNAEAESEATVSLASTAAWWSEEWGQSRSIAWGDVDGDGDLDLAVANGNAYNHVYLNQDGVLEVEASWSATEQDVSYSIAWGDVDSDGDLDLAVGNEKQNRVYLNDGGQLQTTAAWSSAEDEETRSIVWGDVDDDGDLDLATGNIGVNRVYLNQGGVLETTASWSSIEAVETQSVAWGDFDNDGDLDLAVGNLSATNQIYRNQAGRLENSASWSSQEADKTQSVAWADVNNDGYLDLMAGNDGPNRLYLNHNELLQTSAAWSTPKDYNTYDIAWGDFDGDGDLDLAIANGGRFDPQCGCDTRQPNQIYLNQDGTLLPTEWLSDEEDETYSVAWGDVDGDDDLDLATGGGSIRRIYFNEGYVLQPTPAWSANQTSQTTSVAWGDMDSDGDLDLAIGNHNGSNTLYLNQDGTLALDPSWQANISDKTTAIAWGDMDRDGDLDLAVSNDAGPNYVYQNLGTMLDVNPIWTSTEADNSTSIAWGDMDGDGDLDLAVGNGATAAGRAPNRVYLNNDDLLETTASWASSPTEGLHDVTNDITWGDLDGDGDLDLAVGNGGRNRIYRNIDNVLQTTPTWHSEEEDQTSVVAWGDVDNDGDLDLAVGNKGEEPNRIYLNMGETLQPTASWSSQEIDQTYALAWGDVNGDGNLDLATGNQDQPNRIYINLDGQLQTSAKWVSEQADKSFAVAWGDVDNDGDLDLAVGNQGQNQVYVGKGRRLLRTARVQTGSAYIRVATPVTNRNLKITQVVASSDPLLLTTPADFYATARVWREPQIPVAYSLFDPSGEPARFIRAFYSLDGGGNWQPALPVTATATTNLDTLDLQPMDIPQQPQLYRSMLPIIFNDRDPATVMPIPATHLFTWDTLASGFVGQSDNVVLRLEAHLSGVNTFQRATVVAQTYPFRVRSSLQPLVYTETGLAASNALVYRLPEGQNVGAEPFANNSGTPYHTDQRGYLQGRGKLTLGDSLVALLPVEEAGAYEGPYRLYATSSPPTLNGLDFQMVDEVGEQKLTVSAANPLMLFDLDISLEWDARNDSVYREQLVTDLERASRVLYDWTNGQAALGKLHVYQNREKWNEAHIRIYASSTLRPNADKGGIVSEIVTETISALSATDPLPVNDLAPNIPPMEPTDLPTAPEPGPLPPIKESDTLIYGANREIEVETITYGPGQVRIGALWNRFGDASGGVLSEDWPRTLAHELGHYLFFLDDNYLGLNSDGTLITISNCPGAMGDPYQGEDSQGYDEFHPDDADWELFCSKTLSNLETGRADWATIKKFYPWLNAPSDGNQNSGPNTLPLEVTEVTFVEPDRVQAANTNQMPLESPIFFVTESRNGINYNYEPGPQARAILFQEDQNWLVDLGRPELDQIYARGAREGDRLCVIESYDSGNSQQLAAYLMGCKTVRFGDELVELRTQFGWQPEIIVTPLDVDKIEVQVRNVNAQDLPLQARLYPESDPAPPAQPMQFDSATGAYRTTFNITTLLETQGIGGSEPISTAIPALSGHIHIWIDEEEPRREMVTSYSIGGNLAYRLGGFAYRLGGFAYRLGGFAYRLGGFAPIASSDGHVMIFSPDDELLSDELYAIQTATYIPSIPPEASLIGQGYRLITSDSDADLSSLSISMGYMGREVPPGKEGDLIIHYWDGQTWEALPTEVDLRQNNAVARVRGAGLYALMVRIAIPLIGPDWNIFAFPVVGTQPVAEAVEPIADKYQVLYRYDINNKENPWQVHGPDVPVWFDELTDSITDFEFGKVYWIYATETVDWFIKSKERINGLTGEALTIPPAVFYGVLPAASEAGATVTAWIDGQQCGETQAQTVEELANGGTAFVIKVADGAFTSGCGARGNTVTFQVDGVEFGTAQWDNRQLQEVIVNSE